MKIRRRVIGAVVAAVAAFAAVPASAKDVWKLGTAAQPGSVLHDIVMKFINDFNAAAGNEAMIEFQFIGNEQEMWQQVVRGRVQFGASSYAAGAVTMPEGAVMNTPYLWKNDEERTWVTDNYVVPLTKTTREGHRAAADRRRRLERRGLHLGLPDARHQGEEDPGLADPRPRTSSSRWARTVSSCRCPNSGRVCRVGS